MERGMDEWAAHMFRKELLRAVRQFKKDHPGVLEEQTRKRQIRMDQEWYQMEEEYKVRKAAEQAAAG